MPDPKRGSSQRRRLLGLLKQLVAGPTSGEQLRVEPLDGCTMGAVVTGVDLGDLDEKNFGRIHSAFLEFGLLIFRGQHGLSADAQLAFATRFGKIEYLTEAGVLAVSNQKKSGKVLSPEDTGYKVLRSNRAWHSDSTYMPQSSKCAMLFAEVLPPSGGGETEFADMRAAYESIDEPTRSRIEKLRAYHSTQQSVARLTGLFPAKGDRGYGYHGAAQLRPLVKIHPETGRKSIFVASHAFGIPGLSPEESTQLLDDLVAKGCQPPRTYKHSWRLGDLVLWDNRCLLHRARPYDMKSEPRNLRGTRVAGEVESESSLPAPDSEKVLEAEFERLRQLPLPTEETEMQRLR